MLTYLNGDIRFPDVEEATVEGLVAVGGDLSPQRLILSYRQGIFPWYSKDQPVLWWSPDPRGIIPLNKLHIGATLQKILKRKTYEIKFNTAFENVMRSCAVTHSDGESGWITEEMILAYKKLHDLGFAHSVEYWKNGKLAGGLYGIAIGGLFAGESMFYKEPNASKLALIALVERMKVRGFTLLDCQMVTEATKRFGAIEISRKEYLRHLGKALSEPCKFV
jgi:leucyl/phenylalanyl-tRNA--protein transferase